MVTHRVTEVTGAGLIHTKGDANPTADVWDIQPAMVRGSVAWRVPRLGYLLVFLSQPAGIGALACCLVRVVPAVGRCSSNRTTGGGDERRRGRHAATGRRRGTVRPVHPDHQHARLKWIRNRCPDSSAY